MTRHLDGTHGARVRFYRRSMTGAGVGKENGSAIEVRTGLGALSLAELALIESLLTGVEVDLRQVGGETDLVEGRVAVRSDVLRAIVRGLPHPVADIDPRGLQVRGAHFAAPIDISDITFDRPVTFRDCSVDAGFTAQRATLHRLVFSDGTRLGTATLGEPALDATGIRVTSDVIVSDATTAGATLAHAHIGGALECSGGQFAGQGGPALIANGITVIHDVTLAAQFAGVGTDGVVMLLGANIGGHLDCAGGQFTSPDGPALVADGLTVDGPVRLATKYAGASDLGVVRLLGAHLRDDLDCVGGHFVSKDGPALIADGAVVEGRVWLRGVFSGAGVDGVVRLPGARISGCVDCAGGTFFSEDGPALVADNLTTGGDVGLVADFAGSGEAGVVSLFLARIGGVLNCAGGRFISLDGPALVAEELSVAGSVVLAGTFMGAGQSGVVTMRGAQVGGEFTCSGGEFLSQDGPALAGHAISLDQGALLGAVFGGAGDQGVVDLTLAHIRGDLHCTGGRFTSADGPAMAAHGITIDHNAWFDAEFVGAGHQGVVDLTLAHIGGDIDCTGGQFTSKDGPAFVADNLTSDGGAGLAATFEGDGMGVVRLLGASFGSDLHLRGTHALTTTTSPAVILNDASVDGQLVISADFPGTETPPRWLSLDGLTYVGLPVLLVGETRLPEPASARRWAQLLIEHTAVYAAQPWQHVAAAHRAAGDEHEAKRALIAQQDDRRQRVVGKRRARYWLLGFSRALTGYGYRTSLTLLWLVGLAVVAVAVALSSGGMLEHPPVAPDARHACSTVERVGLGLEWALPMVETRASDVCVINSTTLDGERLTVGSWVLQAAGWALATLVVAGYTGIVRRL